VRLGGSARIWLLTGSIVAATVAVYAFGVRALPGAEGETTHVSWLVLAVLFYLAEAFVIHLQFRREAHTLTLNEFGLVLGLLFVSPNQLIAAQLLGAFVALFIHRRQPMLKAWFNLAQFGLTTCIALVVFRAITHSAEVSGPREWAAAMAAAVAASLAGFLLVAAAISLAEAPLELRMLSGVGGISLGGTIANASLALAAAKLIEIDWRATALLVLPFVASAAAYRAQSVHRRQFQHLEFLYDSMRAVQEAPQFGQAVGQLLAAARQLVHAETAEIVLLTDGATRVLRSSAGRNGEESMKPSELSPLEQIALDTVMATGAVLIGARHEPSRLDGYLVERGFHEAILAPLRNEERILGLVIVADREGDITNLTRHDLKLVSRFAGHASVLLENDRLEQSLAELTMLKEKLQHQADHDALTNLPNRGFFSDRVSAALERQGEPAVLFLDLDDFKTVNDSLGHAAGDELLKIVAQRVRACTREHDTPARIGGDEFAVLIEEDYDGEAETLAKRLVKALGEPIALNGRRVSLHLSVGISRAGRGTRSADELLREADIAMYFAKSEGKRHHAVYKPSMQESVHRRSELCVALEHAVEEDAITLRYQPIVDLDEGHTVAIEALARWNVPMRGDVEPEEFIALAEEYGLMVELGGKLLRRACEQASAWQRELGLDSLSLTVNLTPSEIHNPHLPEEVARVLEDTRLRPDRLILEITEEGAMKDPVATIETMWALRRLGVKLALDDFGTGYSSLAHLRDFPIDYLKVAKPFVDRLETDPVGITFVETILRLADSLRLDAIAEGIEDGRQAETLESIGCRLGQGFHYAVPLTEAEVPRFLRTGLRVVA
jgi:diguanylate cyclase (GGDEF)-like protein